MACTCDSKRACEQKPVGSSLQGRCPTTFETNIFVRATFTCGQECASAATSIARRNTMRTVKTARTGFKRRPLVFTFDACAVTFLLSSCACCNRLQGLPEIKLKFQRPFRHFGTRCRSQSWYDHITARYSSDESIHIMIDSIDRCIFSGTSRGTIVGAAHIF